MATHTEHEVVNEVKVQHPKKYIVLLLNDDYSSMDFVIDVLMSIFHKNYEEAEAIMLEIHKKDKGVCGIYTHEIAETKVVEVHRRARDNGFPLKAIMKEE